MNGALSVKHARERVAKVGTKRMAKILRVFTQEAIEARGVTDIAGYLQELEASVRELPELNHAIERAETNPQQVLSDEISEEVLTETAVLLLVNPATSEAFQKYLDDFRDLEQSEPLTVLAIGFAVSMVICAATTQGKVTRDASGKLKWKLEKEVALPELLKQVAAAFSPFAQS